jgi:FlaA1/EpsC-like NDP-sugar epimerase
MRPQKLIKIGIRAAILTILLSTLIYFVYYFTSYNLIVYLEYIFIFLAGAACFIIVLRILNHVTKHKRYRTRLLLTSGFIVIAGIIALVYFRKLTSLLDTMRIKFVNESRYALTNIKITGCQKKQIGDMGPKENTTVWITITRDCSINLSYNENGVEKNEVISAYVTTSMGQQLTFKIGDNK